MEDKLLFTIQSEIERGIKIHVNGKIDYMQQCLNEHNTKHDAAWNRMLPVIEAYERSVHDAAAAKRAGALILYLSGFITAIGGAYIIIRQIFTMRL